MEDMFGGCMWDGRLYMKCSFGGVVRVVFSRGMAVRVWSVPKESFAKDSVGSCKAVRKSFKL